MNESGFITEQLKAAGIPISGVAYHPDGVKIDFDNATEEQRAQAQQIAEQAISDFPQALIIQDAKLKAGVHIESYYAAYKQRNAALGIGFTAGQVAAMVAFINAVRARCDEYEAAESPVIDYSDITP